MVLELGYSILEVLADLRAVLELKILRLFETIRHERAHFMKI